MSDYVVNITLTVNGEAVSERVDARKTLVDFLRDDLFMTGSHVGCEHGVCGACTVRVNGEIVRGSLMLAAQCDGAKVETIEGVSDAGEVADLQLAFEQRNALQCGFCTPAMILTAQELLRQLLPLHRLSRHRRCGRSGRAGTRARKVGHERTRPRAVGVGTRRRARRSEDARDGTHPHQVDYRAS